MSKVNVDEIQVGDLVANYCSIMDKTDLGVVTKVVGEKVYAIWSCFMATQSESQVNYKELEGHWKVINFEEETKVDELKVYTGKETIEALLEGKTLESKVNKHQYKFTDRLLTLSRDSEWFKTLLGFNDILDLEFTEVVTPQVGDWVKVTTHLGNTRTGQVNDIQGNAMKAIWNDNNLDSWITLGHDGWTYEILSPEQVSEYKREQVFAKVGRKLNEFKPDDIVYVESLGEMAVVVSNMNDQEVRLHKVNIRAGLTAKPHQLTPIAFSEQQVDLS
ncbi:hypothetical protein [Pectobacterium phage PcaP2EGY]